MSTDAVFTFNEYKTGYLVGTGYVLTHADRLLIHKLTQEVIRSVDLETSRAFSALNLDPSEWPKDLQYSPAVRFLVEQLCTLGALDLLLASSSTLDTYEPYVSGAGGDASKVMYDESDKLEARLCDEVRRLLKPTSSEDPAVNPETLGDC